MFSFKVRNVAAVAVLGITSVVGVASVASAQSSDTAKAKVVSCTGATEHKQAQVLRLQALALDLQGAQARLADATAKNNAKAVARINTRMGRITARIAQVKANQVKLATKCP